MPTEVARREEAALGATTAVKDWEVFQVVRYFKSIILIEVGWRFLRLRFHLKLG